MNLPAFIEAIASRDLVSLGLKALLVVFCLVVWWQMRRWTEFD